MVGGACGLLLAGCASDRVGRAYDTADERVLRTRLVSAGPLVSVRVTGRALPEGARLSLRITPTGAGVSAGCNDYRGPLDIDGDELRFIGSPSYTLLGCDREQMELEDWIAKLLTDGMHAALTADGGATLHANGVTIRFARERRIPGAGTAPPAKAR